jgi:hypothetical protein
MPVRLSEINRSEIQLSSSPLIGKHRVRIMSEPKWEQFDFTYKNGPKTGGAGTRYTLTIPVEVVSIIETSADPDVVEVKVGQRGYPEMSFLDEVDTPAQQRMERVLRAFGIESESLSPLEADNADNPFDGLVSGFNGVEFILVGRLSDKRTYYTAEGEERTTRDSRYSFYPLS